MAWWLEQKSDTYWERNYYTGQLGKKSLDRSYFK